MALSKEEVAIRLGIDATAVAKGLDSATGYIGKWRKKESAAEKEYTSFWSSELDKRDKLSIEQAIRNNKARAMWRERAANRETEIARKQASEEAALLAGGVEAAARSNRARALLRERAANREVAIAKQQAAEMSAVDSQIAAENAPGRGGMTGKGPKDDSFGAAAMDSAGKKAVSLLKANLFMQVIQLAKDIIPNMTEFWDSVYGTDAATMDKSKQANENIRDLFKSVQDSQKSLKETKEASEFDKMSPEQKWKNVEGKRLAADEAVKKAQADLAHAEQVKEANKHLRAGGKVADGPSAEVKTLAGALKSLNVATFLMGDSNPFGLFGKKANAGQNDASYIEVLKVQAEAQAALNKAKEEQIKAQDLEVKTRDEFFAGSNTKRPDFVPLDGVGVATKRREIAAIDAQMKAGGLTPQDQSRELKNREMAVNQINQTIAGRQAENLEIIKTMLAAEIEARALGKYIQPVAVVDVKDKGK